MAGLDVFGPALSVLFRGQFVLVNRFSALELLKVLLQIGDAPAAAGARSAAFADLTGAAGLVQADVVDDLPLGDVEAVTDFVVKFHVAIGSFHHSRRALGVSPMVVGDSICC